MQTPGRDVLSKREFLGLAPITPSIRAGTHPSRSGMAASAVRASFEPWVADRLAVLVPLGPDPPIHRDVGWQNSGTSSSNFLHWRGGSFSHSTVRVARRVSLSLSLSVTLSVAAFSLSLLFLRPFLALSLRFCCCLVLSFLLPFLSLSLSGFSFAPAFSSSLFCSSSSLFCFGQFFRSLSLSRVFSLSLSLCVCVSASILWCCQNVGCSCEIGDL